MTLSLLCHSFLCHSSVMTLSLLCHCSVIDLSSHPLSLLCHDSVMTLSLLCHRILCHRSVTTLSLLRPSVIALSLLCHYSVIALSSRLIASSVNVFEALMCAFTIHTKYNEQLAAVNCDSDNDRYDIVGCGAAGQPATGPLRSAMRL